MEFRDLESGILYRLLTGFSEGELLFLLASAFVAGLARGFSGFGAALIFMPLASAVIGPRLAAPLLLIIDAVTAIGLIPDAWRRSDRRGVGVMAIGALIGIPRRVLLSSAMLGVRGRIQREGEVVHLVAHELTDRSAEPASVGNREAPFPLPHGRGDEAYHGAPGVDPRSLPKGRNVVDPYDHIDRIKVKTRDFR